MANVTIYTGRWTDWSKGSTLGNQVTLTTSASNTLSAFIAVFITCVGGVAWSLLAYLIHQVRVSRDEKDGFHYQIQTLLRNRLSPTTFSYRLLEASFAWRNQLSKLSIARRALPLSTLALTLYASFVAAGLLLSLVATSGEVLLQNTHGGFYNYSLIPNTEQAQDKFYRAQAVYTAQQVKMAYSYARVCYESSTDTQSGNPQAAHEPTANCKFYAKSSLNWTTTRTSKCPFSEGICAGSGVNAIVFDSGYISTDDELGINTHKEDVLLFRRVTTCAPLITDGFTEGFVNQSSLGLSAIYNYGVNVQEIDNILDLYGSNATFVYSYNSFVANDQAYRLLYASTTLMCAFSTYDAPCFTPVPRLAPENTSITLLFLANRAFFPAPVHDPWFTATSKVSSTSPHKDEHGYFYSSVPATVLGCVEEVELCNPTSNHCIDWNPYRWILDQDQESVAPLQLNDHQILLAQTIGRALYHSQLALIIEGLGFTALLASEYLDEFTGLDSLELESDQWTIELQNLMSMSMSLVQRSVVVDITGPTDPELTQYITPVPGTEWNFGNQKIYDSGYSSFSSLGLGLIFGFGGLILLVGALITFATPAIQRRTGKGELRRREWYANDLLRLQRIAFEDRGLGHWMPKIDDDSDNIPVTHGRETIVSFIKVQELKRPESPRPTVTIVASSTSRQSNDSGSRVSNDDGMSLSTSKRKWFARIFMWRNKSAKNKRGEDSEEQVEDVSTLNIGWHDSLHNPNHGNTEDTSAPTG